MRARILYKHDGSGWNALLPTGDVFAFPKSGGVLRQWATASTVEQLEPDAVNWSSLLRWRSVQRYVRRWWKALPAEYRAREWEVSYIDGRGELVKYRRNPKAFR